MADSNYTHSDLTVHGRHVPDFSREIDANGNPYQQELPGHYEIGVEIDGAFVPIARLKAAGLFADIQRAQSAQGSQQQQGEQSAVTPSGEQQGEQSPEQQQTV